MLLQGEELQDARLAISRVFALLHEMKKQNHCPLGAMEDFFVIWSNYAQRQYKGNFEYTVVQYQWLLDLEVKLKGELGNDGKASGASGR